MKRQGKHRTGFTLVETALALLAISLGLLGIFGLARHGLKASGDADEETRCALLADTVFATLRAKNDELAEKKASLEEWWFYWLRFVSGEGGVVIYLPAMPELSETAGALPLRCAPVFSEFVSAQEPAKTLPWRPSYRLTPATELNLADTGALSALYERGQLDLKLEIHPGALLSGAETRTYYTVLTYTGGLP